LLPPPYDPSALPQRGDAKRILYPSGTKNRTNKKHKHDNGSYRWYRVQAMFVIMVLTIIEQVLVYKECETNDSNKIVSVIITLPTTVFTIMAVVSLLRIYTRFKS
jgi:membrane protein YdbS with pleckstrin-like domain